MKIKIIALTLLNMTLALCLNDMIAQVPGLKAYYKFDGNSLDQSGSGFNATFDNATSTDDRFGNSNKAYSFDGTSTYLTIDKAVYGGTNSYSFCLWIKTDDPSNGGSYNASVLNIPNGGNQRFQLAVTPAGKALNYTYCNAANVLPSTSSINDNSWHHVAGVIDDNTKTFKIYVDGVLEGSQAYTCLTTSSENLQIGRFSNIQSDYFKGAIDELMIFNRGLSDAEVLDIFNCGIAPIMTTIDTAICAGKSFQGYSNSIDVTHSYTTPKGCDSIRRLILTVLPYNNTTVNKEICNGDSYASYSTAGTYVDVYTDVRGCDSTRTLNLSVVSSYTTTASAVICSGQNYAGHYQSGTYTDTYTTFWGCDSTRTLNLTVLPPISTTVNVSICSGTNYQGYNQSGTYTDIYTTAEGCDSIRILNLFVEPLIITNIDTSICLGESYAGHTQTGNYSDIYTTVKGCDSIVVINLMVKDPVMIHLVEQRCEGDSFKFATKTVFTTGSYMDTLPAANGCDSVIILDIVFIPLTQLQKPILVASDSIVCPGENIKISIQQTYPDYRWSNGSTDSFIVVNTAGPFSVTVTDNVCASAVADPITFKISYLQAAPVVLQNGDGELTTNIENSERYQWYYNGTLIYNATDPNLTTSQSGMYEIEVSDSLGCTVRSAAYPFTASGIKNIANFNVNVYPNPVETSIMIETDVQADKIEVFDMLGQKVFEIFNPTLSQNIDFSAFASGVYHLKIVREGSNIVKRVTKR